MKTMTNKNINILNKIKHKPILLELIFSFAEKRFYIIIDFISKDKSLKSELKKFFDKTKQKNSLSKELNRNIKNYIFYRKFLEKYKFKDIIDYKYTFHEFSRYFSQDLNNNKGKDDKNDSSKNDINYEDEIYDFIVRYKIRHDKNKLFLAFINIFINKECLNFENKINNDIDFYYSDIDNILEQIVDEKNIELFFRPFDLMNFMERNNNFIFFFEFFIFIYYNYFKKIPKNLLQTYSFLHITQYFEQNNININNINDINNFKITPKFIEDYYYKVKKFSIIERIIVKFNFHYDYEINLNFLFCLLSLESSLSLYNFQNKNKNPDNYIFLDKLYLDYIEKTNINQKIKLICIIDSNKYSYNNPRITYRYVNELYFTSNKYNLNEIAIFPINEIYSIFKHYLMAIKYSENLETISFDDEFFIKRKIYNNDFLLNHLFNQYLLDNNREDNILNKININNITIKTENFNNIYDFYKTIFVFNKMFPKLKNKFCLELNYNKINKILSKDINFENNLKI